MAVPAVKIDHLTKIYSADLGKKPMCAVDDLNLEVEQGEVFAFLGPNGAGKTTTIKTMMRLLFPTRGFVEIFGIPNLSVKAMRSVGFLPEQPQIYGYLTGREFLDFTARLFRLDRSTRKKRIDDCLEQVGLIKRADGLIRGYSRGMMQRLGLAQALINDPELLVLDEPMSNLDPVGRKEFRDLILELKDKGKTLFFSSHILSDAEMIADRVGIVNQGRLVNTGKLRDLIEAQIRSIEITFIMTPDKTAKLGFEQANIVQQDEHMLVRLENDADVQRTIGDIMRLDGRIVSVVPQKRTLEDIFMTELGG
ncbi:ABC transporter ATP-binding protein [bacterium]|nr:ABC transporter ATP-binding protein [bacterium]